MNLKLIRTAMAAIAISATAFTANADSAASLIVVEKDGTVVTTPLPEVSRVYFDSSDFTVLSKDGKSESYDYSDVSKIEFGTATGIILPKKDARFALWPSIATSSIHVSGTDATQTISIYNLSGVQMISAGGSEDTTTIDVSNLPAGHYVAKAGNSTIRFIKK